MDLNSYSVNHHPLGSHKYYEGHFNIRRTSGVDRRDQPSQFQIGSLYLRKELVSSEGQVWILGGFHGSLFGPI